MAATLAAMTREPMILPACQGGVGDTSGRGWRDAAGPVAHLGFGHEQGLLVMQGLAQRFEALRRS